MNDRVLQDGSQLIQRVVLGIRDVPQWPLIRWLKRQSQCFKENMRRNMVGVRDKADIHPALNRLVAVITPINRVAHGTVCVQAGKSQD